MTRWIPLFSLASLLAACPYMGPDHYDARIRDFDGDGYVAERFGGPDCVDDDPSIGDCDADSDGAKTTAVGGDDCDDTDAAVNAGALEICDDIDQDCDALVDDADPDLSDAPIWYADLDADGYPDEGLAVPSCAAPADFVAERPDSRWDCDDVTAFVHPLAAETCDLLDRDCDGDPYLGSDTTGAFWYPDGDGDGWGDLLLGVEACVAPDVDWVDLGGDCNDFEATAHPSLGGALDEVCDGIDNDCDGLYDEDDPDLSGVLLNWFVDADGDGYGDPATAAFFCPGTEPNGYLLQTGDCDDRFASVNPAGVEICDDLDNNCNGAVDDNAIDRTTYYQDADGDGHGTDLFPVLACDADAGSGLSATPDDCNDADAQTYLDAFEICGDSVRQDCSTTLSAADCDGDSYDDVVFGGTDCDDTDPGTNPDASEICDGLDNDCDDRFDDDDPNVDLSTIADFYGDADGDGYGDPNALLLPNACAPQPGLAANTLDCDDSVATGAAVYPGAPEICDGLDNDCDTLTDDADTTISDPPTWYFDLDADGFGDAAFVFNQTCSAPPTDVWSLVDGDCNPNEAATNPMAAEICDGLDNDCDGFVDDADPAAQLSLWYLDGDGDGWGLASVALAQCAQPAGYVPASGDCNDFAAAANPGAAEVCDGGVDNDCDGFADDADPQLAAGLTWYDDADSDGYGDPATTVVQCGAPPGHVANALDCDDAAATVSPASAEVCDGGIDNDCDGSADDLDGSLVNAPIWFVDVDLDGWGNDLVFVRACDPVLGYRAQGGDCDDGNNARYPGAVEVCDTLDNDCDTLVDQFDASVVLNTWHADVDGDGFGSDVSTVLSCTDPGGYLTSGGDCNDAIPAVNPLALEVCGSGDEDCDGLVDDADPSVSGASKVTFFADSDHDGWTDGFDLTLACAPPFGFLPPSAAPDCADNDASRYPFAPERCNGSDDDCDGLSDAIDIDRISDAYGWPDADGDGYGVDALGVPVCAAFPPVGIVFASGDCDDGDVSIAPGLPELCNAIDDDCDGLTDDADPPVTGGGPYFADQDLDGRGALPFTSLRCAPAPGWSIFGDDCDDSNPTISPFAIELCDGVDNDCDLGVDDLDPQGVAYGNPLYSDQDSDGSGGVLLLDRCLPDAGHLATDGDCNDADSSLFPGQTLTVGPAASNYTSLQAAIDAACSPATLSLLSGVVYTPASSLVMQAKVITVEGPVLSWAQIDAGNIAPVLQISPGDPDGITFRRIEFRSTAPTGSVVNVNGGSLLLDTVWFHDRTLGIGSTGGAINVSGGGIATIESATFESLEAQTGGAIYASGGSTVIVTSSEVFATKATSSGHFLHADNSTVVIAGVDSTLSGITGGWTLAAVNGSSMDVFDFEGFEGGGIQFSNARGDVSGLDLEWGGNVLISDALAPVSVVTITKSTLRDTLGAGVTVTGNQATLNLSNVEILRPTGVGLSATSNAQLFATQVTILGAGSNSATLGNWVGDFRNSVFLDSVAATAVTNVAGPQVQYSLYPTLAQAAAAGATNIGWAGTRVFQTYHPLLDPSLWDLHAAPGGQMQDAGDPSILDCSIPGDLSDLGAPGGLGGDCAYFFDADSDGLPDGWEDLYFGLLIHTQFDDIDADGLDNAAEYVNGTHPWSADTDNDGSLDSTEVVGLTNPLDPTDP